MLRLTGVISPNSGDVTSLWKVIFRLCMQQLEECGGPDRECNGLTEQVIMSSSDIIYFYFLNPCPAFNRCMLVVGCYSGAFSQPTSSRTQEMSSTGFPRTRLATHSTNRTPSTE